jgi:hypothetical protein
MGGGQSTKIREESEASDKGACLPCLPFQAPFARSSDPIGSPMPETPLHTRRKQHLVEDAILEKNRHNQVFSSKYGGLEKEVEENGNGNGNMAQIHEGKVRNFLADPESTGVNESPNAVLFLIHRMQRQCCMPSTS